MRVKSNNEKAPLIASKIVEVQKKHHQENIEIDLKHPEPVVEM